MSMTQTGPAPAERPSVSVIIPVYNSLSTLGRALSSVFGQTIDAITEVMVVDDGSEEDIEGFLARHFPQVIHLRQKRSGPAPARNAGVARATGDLVAFLDADDVWLPDKLEKQLAVLAQRPEVEFLLSRHYRVYPSGHRIAGGDFPEVFQIGLPDWFSSYRRRRLGRPMCPSGFLMTRRLYLQLGGQDTGWTSMADWHLVMRALIAHHAVLIMGEPLFDYHIVPGSVSNHHRKRDLQRLSEQLLGFMTHLQHSAEAGEVALDPLLLRRLILEERITRSRLLLRHGYLQGAYETLLPVFERTTPAGTRLGQWPAVTGIRMLRQLLGHRSTRLQQFTLAFAQSWYKLVP